jgi:hypothetical protein
MDANPLGAPPESVTTAAKKIGAILQAEQAQAPAPEKKPEPVAEAAPEQAPAPEAPPEEPQADPTEEPDTDSVELADTIEGLAEQLGVPADQLPDHLKVTVKINGEEQRVTLKEAISGYQKDADYRNKTAEISKKSQAVEQLSQEVAAERQHFANALNPFIQHLNILVSEDDRTLARLANDDPYEYAQLKPKAEQRKVALQAAVQQQQALQHQNQQDAHRQYVADVEAEERKLVEIYPDWMKDTAKGREEIKSLREYAKTVGVPEHDANAFYKASFFQILDESRSYRALQAGKAETKKVLKYLPKVQKPGAEQPRGDPQKQKLAVAKNKLRNSGSVKDAAMVIKQLLK